MNLPELSDNEMAVLQAFMDGGDGRSCDARDIGFQARAERGLDHTVDIRVLLKRLEELGYLTIAKDEPIDPNARRSETPRYRISASGRGRVLSQAKGAE